MSLLNGKKLAVIGDPIAHSLSPVIQQAMLDALGLDCTYERIRVVSGNVAEWLPTAEGLGLRGFNATMPHKTDLVPLMDELSEDAKLFRSVNTVALRDGRYLGFNTDGEGFLRSLLDEGIEVQGRKVAVFGAGGAARAVVLKLAASGVEGITVCCRRPIFSSMPRPLVCMVWELISGASTSSMPCPAPPRSATSSTAH